MTVGSDVAYDDTHLSPQERTLWSQFGSRSVSTDPAVPASEGGAGGGTVFVSHHSGTFSLSPGVGGAFFQGGGARSITGPPGTGATTIIGGEGNDTVSTGGGDDAVAGGGGADVLDSGSGADTAYGGSGNDIVRGAGAGAGPDPSAGNAAALTGPSAGGAPPWFDADWYVLQNRDVAAALEAGRVASAFEHFLSYGEPEGRAPNAYFDPTYYLETNPDVHLAVRMGVFSSAFEHFLMYGAEEARAPIRDLVVEQYLEAHPDVADAVAAGTLNISEHLVLYGAAEGRGLSAENVFDGGDGDDFLYGGYGDDSLDGGAGRDTLSGGADDDTMTGGDGADVFVIEDGSGRDRIEDFEIGRDILRFDGPDVSAQALIDAVEDVDGNAVITLSNGHTITLVGVDAELVTATLFDIR
jgi:hypothetical protein